MVGVRVGAKI